MRLSALLTLIPLATCTSPHLLRDLVAPAPRPGFLVGPLVTSNNSALQVSGNTSTPGQVRCILSPVSATTMSFNASLLAPNLTAEEFWALNSTPPTVAQTVQVQAGWFTMELSAEYGALFSTLCAFQAHDTNPPPVPGTPALAIVGQPRTKCARALMARSNPVLQLEMPEYPWQKMKLYSAPGVGGVDIGQYDSCLVQQNTTFCNLHIQVATAGMCLPDACTADTVPQDYDFVVKSELAMYASLLLEAQTSLEEPEINNTTKAALLVAATLLAPALEESTLAVLASSMGQWICADATPELPGEVWLWAVPLLCLLALGLAASVHEALALSNQDLSAAVREPTGLRWAVGQFSLLRTWRALVNTRPGDLQFFDGLRYIAATWVILGHTELFSQQAPSGFSNPSRMLPHDDGHQTEEQLLWFQLVPGGFFAVDTFFWIGGFFATFIMLRRAARTPGLTQFGLSMPLMYLGRYLRLVPSVLAALGAYWLLLPSLGSGPGWAFTDAISKGCSENWWRELLFVTDWGSQKHMNCMGVTWYLTCDFFYFVCTPFLIMLYTWRPRAGVGACLALFVASVVASGQDGHHYGLKSQMFVNSAVPERAEAWAREYFHPWMRASPYIVGVLFAMRYNALTQHAKQTGQPRKLSFWSRAVLQLLGTAVLCYCVFSVQSDPISAKCSSEVLPALPYANPDCGSTAGASDAQSGTVPQWIDDLHNALARGLFGVGLSLLAEAWIWGGEYNLARWILSLPIMSVLGKLSFNAYLWHMVVLQWFYCQQLTTVAYTRLNMLVYWLGVSTIAFWVALIAYLFVEEPFAQLSTALLKWIEAALKPAPKAHPGEEGLLGSSAEGGDEGKHAHSGNPPVVS